jgi:putative resolvase
MKLSAYAKQVGVTYSTAHAWWRAVQLDASHLPSGAIMVRETTPRATGVALSARVSSAAQQDDLTRQLQRLRESAAARGYQVVAVVSEVTAVTESASDLTEERPTLTQLLTAARGGVLVVERQDRLTRFGYGFIAALVEQEGRRVQARSPSDSGAELVDDCVAVITSMAARISGRRHAKRRAAQMQACVKRCVEQAEQVADT